MRLLRLGYVSHLTDGGITLADPGRSCFLPLPHFPVRQEKGGAAVLRQKEERSIAAQQCELRDCSVAGLRRHGADIVYVHIITTVAPTIRPRY